MQAKTQQTLLNQAVWAGFVIIGKAGPLQQLLMFSELVQLCKGCHGREQHREVSFSSCVPKMQEWTR